MATVTIAAAPCFAAQVFESVTPETAPLYVQNTFLT
eukprot:CAMPEP_0168483388 /NCGR_PEP_ID=MMETSP0228-20121227/65543_1 /TAXON_ID=133427 /ORGANISM="Protoceratium reticulatum, Strain CCCM 535 (=CCMP 1889)" /LENGTH=35 /DNA_ID= /DNA_START= /DNA_END= /DNA_ORIENTATION=